MVEGGGHSIVFIAILVVFEVRIKIENGFIHKDISDTFNVSRPVVLTMPVTVTGIHEEKVGQVKETTVKKVVLV